MYRTNISLTPYSIPTDLISSAVAHRCFEDFPWIDAFDEVLSESFAEQIAAAPTEGYPWRAFHCAADVAMVGHLLGRGTSPQISTLLQRHPKVGAVSWTRAEFKLLAAQHIGAVDSDDGPHPGRLQPMDFGLDVALMDACAAGVPRDAGEAVVQILLGLGWSAEIGRSPELSLLVPSVDSRIVDLAPTAAWRQWLEATRCPYTTVDVASTRRVVRATVGTMTFPFTSGDLAAAATLLHLAASLRPAISTARFDGRSWPSWERKLGDPSVGLIIVTDFEGAVSAPWIALARIYFDWLIGAFARVNVEIARLRWKVGGVVVCDVPGGGDET